MFYPERRAAPQPQEGGKTGTESSQLEKTIRKDFTQYILPIWSLKFHYSKHRLQCLAIPFKFRSVVRTTVKTNTE